MTTYKVARWIRNGTEETAFHEEKYTTSFKRARRIYNVWEKDPLTTRLVIWETEHGCTTPLMSLT